MMKSAYLTICAALAFGTPAISLLAPVAHAQTADGASAPVSALYAALKSIQSSGSGDAQARAAIVAPAVDKAFALDTILHKVVGLKYDSFTDAQKQSLLAAFRQYTVASYVDSFKPGSDTRFSVTPATRPAPGGTGQLVTTHIGGSNDSDSTEIDYPMQQGSDGWQITDVLLQGHISQAAAQRAEFRSALASGGVDGLITKLQAKAKNFLGG